MGDMNSLLKTAIDETKHVREGKIFFVKDLFKGYEWQLSVPATTSTIPTRIANQDLQSLISGK